MKIKRIGLAVAIMLLPLLSFADEGMWMVNLFQKSIYPAMVKKGLKMKAGEIYNADNNMALSNAIVSLDFGCTASMISPNGLMITNHHCAYGDIHDLSTNEHNYLEEGFWAMKNEEEKPIPGKNALFLKKVVDVTAEVQQIVDDLKAKKFKGMVMRRAYKEIEQKYSKATPYEVMCASVWNGINYYLFYYEVYRDVRLVGAPPVSIGAFGGETDNWGWPQHKGDFALYRVYCDPDGKPAKYSKDNVPYKPSRYLTISTQGVKANDYAMIMGYPGRTNRYASSFEIEQKQNITNPIIVEARRSRLDVWKKAMDSDSKLRLLYSDKYFGISNYCDYAKWENICLKRYDVINLRAKEEAELETIEPGLLERMKSIYSDDRDLVRDKTWYRETYLMPCDWIGAVRRFIPVIREMQKCKSDTLCINNKKVKSQYAFFVKNCKGFDMATDIELFKTELALFIKHLPAEYCSDTLNTWIKRYNGDASKIVDYIYSNSLFSSVEGLKKRLESGTLTLEQLQNDPAVLYSNACQISGFNKKEYKINCKHKGDTPDNLESTYTKAFYKLKDKKGIPQYPNANSTMRITYGTVGGINPRDAVEYGYRTTINGYREKENNNDYDFRVNDKMKGLLAGKDWGRWGEKGELYVDFLTNNDITGGNSGSPVMNAKGELIGLAFDGNRESMSGDVYFHPEYFKTVCVDIRFVMWIIDKYAGANYLFNEMTLK